MAASSGDGIPAQLAALLGRPVKRIRITDETPPRISVIDVATAITGKHVRNAARDVLFVQEKHPEVFQKLSHFRFPGQGQRSAPVTCATGLIGAWQMQGRSGARPEGSFIFFFGIRPSRRRRAVKERPRRSVERAPQAPARPSGAAGARPPARPPVGRGSKSARRGADAREEISAERHKHPSLWRRAG